MNESTGISDADDTPIGAAAVVVAPSPALGLRRTDVPEAFEQQLRMAELLASAGSMVPQHLQGDPGAVFAVMAWARTLDIGVAIALREMFIVHGSVGMTAGLMDALIMRAGHSVHIVSETASQCVLKLDRRDDNRDDRIEGFTWAEAIQAGLVHKDNWKLYPKDMLYWRTMARLARRHARDVVLGFGYTRDELETAGIAEPERDDGDIAEAVASIVAEAARDDVTHDEVVELGKSARQRALLRQYTPEGEQVQAMLMRRLRELAPSQEASSRELSRGEAEVELARLECGCDAEAVVQAGDHAEGCPLRVSNAKAVAR